MKDDTPAFPTPQEWNGDGNQVPSVREGMTLRDYFAAAALQGQVASNVLIGTIKGFDDWKDAAAFYSYEIADAMLKERNK